MVHSQKLRPDQYSWGGSTEHSRLKLQQKTLINLFNLVNAAVEVPRTKVEVAVLFVVWVAMLVRPQTIKGVRNCVKIFDTMTPNGPERPSIQRADAAPQLHQTGHSSMAKLLRRMKVSCAGRSCRSFVLMMPTKVLRVSCEKWTNQLQPSETSHPIPLRWPVCFLHPSVLALYLILAVGSRIKVSLPTRLPFIGTYWQRLSFCQHS